MSDKQIMCVSIGLMTLGFLSAIVLWFFGIWTYNEELQDRIYDTAAACAGLGVVMLFITTMLGMVLYG